LLIVAVVSHEPALSPVQIRQDVRFFHAARLTSEISFIRTKRWLTMLLAQERDALAAAGRRLAAAGLVTGISGNLSARRNDLVAVTPTGAALAELTADMMTVIDSSGTVVEGTLAPTSEVPMHLAIYAATGTAAIAHTHAACSTAIACTRDVIPLVHYLMLGLGGEIRVAPYATFGTVELAGHVVTALAGRQAALMRNHGSIATGGSVREATDNLELTEWCAELYARCLMLGEPRLLTSEDAAAFGRQVRATGYGTTRRL
jgi:L-fuculose-phosphate aldolase